MATEVKAPVLPESVADGTIATWHKKVGDAVKRDENLLDLETDKVVLEVPSPVDGVLKEIKFAEGSTVTSSQVVAIIEEGAVAAAPAPTAEAAPAAAPAAASTASAAGVRASVRAIASAEERSGVRCRCPSWRRRERAATRASGSPASRWAASRHSATPRATRKTSPASC